jgi:hypothetical protein
MNVVGGYGDGDFRVDRAAAPGLAEHLRALSPRYARAAATSPSPDPDRTRRGRIPLRITEPVRESRS